MARNQKSVRYDDGRNNVFTLYSTFGREDCTSPEYFRWILKCYESKARGSPERDGLRRLKRPELRGVIEQILPLEPLPDDFENRSRQGRKSALARLASDRAKEATSKYERNSVSVPLDNQASVPLDNQASVPLDNQPSVALDNQASVPPDNQASVPPDNQASVPLDRGCGSRFQLDNPEGHFSDQQLIDMLFSKLEIRASKSGSEDWLEFQGLKANFTDWFNALQMKECLGVDSGSSPVQSPDGTQAEGGGWDASQSQDRGQDVVSATEEGDTDGLRDVDTSFEFVQRLTGRKRANEEDIHPPLYNGDEDIERQLPMKRPMVKNPMPPSSLGSQLEGSSIHGGGENVRSPVTQILHELGEKQLELFDPVDGGQQHDHELLAHEGDDTQANHLDDMQVDEINAADPVSAGWQVDASFSISGNTSEEIHSTWAEGVGCDASYSHSREVFMEDGNTESLSDILEGVPWHTGRNRADMEDICEQLPPPNRFTDDDLSAFVQEYFGEKYLEDPNQYSADLRDQVNAPNTEGGVHRGFCSTSPAWSPYRK